MNAQSYGAHIKKQIQGWPVEEPIKTAAVAAAVAADFDIALETAKKVTNVNLKRLTDNGELARIQKGVYGKIKTTAFGRLMPSTDEIISGLLLWDGGKTIGYLAGPTLLNVIGLCSWMPRERHITTNNYRHRIPRGTLIRTYKPLTDVNDDNAIYLQMLEAFTAIEQYPVDADNPEDILRGMLRSKNVNNKKLILYARRYFGQKTLLRTIDVALGGIEE